MDNIDLRFDEDALKAVARRSIQLKTGARGLRSVLENIMMDFMFDAPTDKQIESIVIDRSCVEKGSKPKITRKKAS